MVASAAVAAAAIVWRLLRALCAQHGCQATPAALGCLVAEGAACKASEAAWVRFTKRGGRRRGQRRPSAAAGGRCAAERPVRRAGAGAAERQHVEIKVRVLGLVVEVRVVRVSVVQVVIVIIVVVLVEFVNVDVRMKRDRRRLVYGGGDLVDGAVAGADLRRLLRFRCRLLARLRAVVASAVTVAGVVSVIRAIPAANVGVANAGVVAAMTIVAAPAAGWVYRKSLHVTTKQAQSQNVHEWTRVDA